MSSTIRKIWIFSLTLLYLMIGADARKGPKFNRMECRDEIADAQKLANFTFNTPEYFLQDKETGRLYNGNENMTLTLAGCNHFCGPWTFYWDAGPRVTTWIIPVLLLLSNIELSPIDKTRFMTILHAIGDPIDSFWSLIHKIYIWHRLYAIGLEKSSPKLPQEKINFFVRVYWKIRIALMWKKNKSEPKDNEKLRRAERAQVIATVLAGFEEIAGFGIESEDYYHMITQELGQLGTAHEDEKKFEDWRRTARILADARTNEFSRTLLAIVVFIFGLIAAFIPALGGGNTSPPGGRIGSAIFLSWLVPLALLSNTIGTFTSRRTCLTIMRQFVWTVSRVDRKDSRWTSFSGRISPRPEGVLDDVHDHTMEETRLTRPQNVGRRSSSRRRDSSQISPQTRDPPSFSMTQKSLGKVSQDGIRMDTLNQPRGSGRQSISPGRVSISVPEGSPQTQSDYFEREPLIGPGSLAPLNINVPNKITQSREESVDLIRKDSWEQYWASLQWRGAIYTYRPWKVLYLDTDNRPRAHFNNAVMAFVAFIPIAISAAGAAVIIWDAVPKGFSCRHIWVICITIAWIISAVLTSVIYAFYKTPTNGHKLWKFILYKDAIIGIISLLVILLSTVGAFNFCWCWSAYMQRRKDAYVPLDTDKVYESNAKSLYSAVVGTCIMAQLIFYVAIMMVYRRGLRLVRWTEDRRRKEWMHEMHDPAKRTDDTFLLFWYKKEHLRK